MRSCYREKTVLLELKIRCKITKFRISVKHKLILTEIVSRVYGDTEGGAYGVVPCNIKIKMAEFEYESISLVKPEAFVYHIPPRSSTTRAMRYRQGSIVVSSTGL